MKKAQSNVIVMVLLLLIAVVAILIVVNIVVPLVRERGGEAETSVSLLGIDLDVAEIILRQQGSVNVRVSRGAGRGILDAIMVVFYDEEGNSHSEKVSGGIDELGSKMYSFSPFDDLGKIDSVSVFPVTDDRIGREASSSKKVLEVPGGIISWWKFDNSLDDFIENKNPCTGSVEYGEGLGQSAVFTSAISCGSSQSLDIQDKFALSFWIKTQGDGNIISKGDNYDVSVVNGKVEFSYLTESAENSKSVSDNMWHHVALSIDWIGDGTGDSKLRVYVDGQLVNTIDMVGEPEPDDRMLSIGSLNMQLDEVMLFNEGLYITEVQGIYNNQVGSFS